MPLFLIPNAANLTGDTLAAGVTASSLTSVGTLTALTVSGQASFTDGSAAAPSVKVGTGNDGMFSIASGNLGLAASGRVALRLDTIASSVNYLYGYANVTGGAPVLRALGSDTNVGLILSSQAAGSVDIMTGGATLVAARFAHVANAVNFWQIGPGATGNVVTLTATGTDTNVHAAYVTKGTGDHFFYSGNTAAFVMASGGASAVNYLQTQAGATGIAPSMTSQGTDTNIDFAITPKGTGVLRFGTHSALAGETVTGYITIKDSSGTTRKVAILS